MPPFDLGESIPPDTAHVRLYSCLLEFELGGQVLTSTSGSQRISSYMEVERRLRGR